MEVFEFKQCAKEGRIEELENIVELLDIVKSLDELLIIEFDWIDRLVSMAEVLATVDGVRTNFVSKEILGVVFNELFVDEILGNEELKEAEVIW